MWFMSNLLITILFVMSAWDKHLLSTKITYVIIKIGLIKSQVIFLELKS